MPKDNLLYEYLVIIIREGVSEIIPFESKDYPENVEKYFDRASTQWSDSYLCKVIKGPIKIC